MSRASRRSGRPRRSPVSRLWGLSPQAGFSSPRQGNRPYRLEAAAVNPSPLHDMTLTDDEAACRRCHYSANLWGLLSMVLPAKSILCMPCHAATFSAADTTTVARADGVCHRPCRSLSYWFSGSLPGLNATGLIFKGNLGCSGRSSEPFFHIKFFCHSKKFYLGGASATKIRRLSPVTLADPRPDGLAICFAVSLGPCWPSWVLCGRPAETGRG